MKGTLAVLLYNMMIGSEGIMISNLIPNVYLVRRNSLEKKKLLCIKEITDRIKLIRSCSFYEGAFCGRTTITIEGDH